MIWRAALGVRWDIFRVRVKIEKGRGCCRQCNVRSIDKKKVNAREESVKQKVVSHFIQCKKVVKVSDSRFGTSKRNEKETSGDAHAKRLTRIDEKHRI